ncbi:DUF389 domain-containing protein [Salsipaludibacter albus]|uniref:DUF389 domain-containing protein n=1 Tax=Salsipaludibacter albus TaxID=2849650 RepID=UPI001EE439EB|nr:DUF389 domain-containing protein [Salsipaludibacter albus]MBY5160895.1 DUF389 domain-containing protein [Salsipaludibacter albus]
MSGDGSLSTVPVDEVDSREGMGERDMTGDVPLLGVPWADLWSPDTLRGLVLFVLAVAVLLWPERSDQVLARLAGVGLGVMAVTLAVDLVRHRDRRTFRRMLSLGVSLGLASGLIIHPSQSLSTAAQLVGGLLVALAVLDVVLVGTRRRTGSWFLVRAGALLVVGVILLVWPDASVVAVLSIAAFLTAAVGLIEVLTPASSIVRDVGGSGRPGTRALAWISQRPDLAEDRDVLMDKVYFEGEQAPTRYVRWVALMTFASIIASIGVVVESTAVVIGAMLIAPLMTPLMGLAMAVPMGWPRRLRRSGGIALSGIALAIGIGALVGGVIPRAVDVTSNTEILARISPTLVDMGIAVAAGAAGAYALARRDVSDSLPGVAVAIALVPPLTVVGLCWQQAAWSAGNGALLLFTTNGLAIVLAGGAVFVLVGAAPLERVSASQHRVRTVLTGFASVGILVVLLLGLNGAEITQREATRAQLDQVMADWSSEHEDYRVNEVRVSPEDGTITIDLAGPGEPPGLDALASDLRAVSSDAHEVQVTWVPLERIVITD